MSDVIVHSQIQEWVYNDSGLIVGAKVKVIAHAPGRTDAAVPFSGKLHLSFTGYASPTEDDTEG